MFRLQKVKAQGLLNFDRNHPKLFGIDEKLPKDSGEIFVLKICQKCSTSGQKTWRGWLWKLKICTEANQTLLFKRLKTAVAPFIVQISPKYFHSLEPQNLITFNLSQIFETHPYTSLLKFWLTPLLLLPPFNSSQKIYWKWKWFPNISLWNNCFLGKWGQRCKLLLCTECPKNVP